MQRPFFFMIGLDKTTGNASVQACNEKTRKGTMLEGLKENTGKEGGKQMSC
jgi:hypothetical protein